MSGLDQAAAEARERAEFWYGFGLSTCSGAIAVGVFLTVLLVV